VSLKSSIFVINLLVDLRFN